MSGLAAESSGGAEKVAVEQPADGEAVSKALGHVNSIVENIAKSLGLAQAAVTAPAAPAAAPAVAAKTEEGGEDTDVEKGGMSFETLLKSFGVELNAETQKKMKAAGFDPSQKFPTAKKPTEKTTKSKEVAGDDAPVTMAGFFDLITKAKKFTPGRVESLKSAFETLKSLLEEIEEVPQGTMPGVSPSGSTQFGASGVKVLTEGTTKSVGEQILEGLNGLANVVKSLQENQAQIQKDVEGVTKARQPSSSLEGEGGTDAKVKKSSMWSGVL